MSGRKIFGIVIIIALIIAAGIFIGIKNKQTEDQKKAELVNNQKAIIKISRIATTFTPGFPFYVAQEKGFFAKNGLEAKFVTEQPGTNVSALLAKQIDYAPFSQEAVSASLKGAKVKTFITYATNGFIALVAQPEMKLQDIKTIGLTSLSTGIHLEILKIMKENNISPEVIAVGESQVALKASLLQKKVDAIGIPITAAYQLQNDGYTILATSENGSYLRGVAATDEKLKNNPEEVKKFIRSLEMALEFIKNNPKETNALHLKFVNMEPTDANKKIVDLAYPIVKKTFSVALIPSKEDIEMLIKSAKIRSFKTYDDIAKQTVSEEEIQKSVDFSLLGTNE